MRDHLENPYHIYQWNEISAIYSHTIILGNGASIGISKKFNYANLLNKASTLPNYSKSVELIFNEFKTVDFELVLRLLWQANKINELVGVIDNKTGDEYRRVRDLLVNAVRAVHPTYATIEPYLDKTSKFLRRFKTVLSLNYDLIVYWSMMRGNNRHYGTPYSFKDCFINSDFNEDIKKFRTPINGSKDPTLVFYPHGNLILAQGLDGGEKKLQVSNSSNILDEIIEKWNSGQHIPLFVSEGTAEMKVKSIKRSDYLNFVRHNIISCASPNIVIYGWGVGDQDQHIIDQISSAVFYPSNIAISVFNGNQEFQEMALRKINSAFNRKMNIMFFDSCSSECWIY